MRDQYLDAALDRLTDLIDSGVTLTTAHESVVINYELTPHEAHVLSLRYESMLHDLDKTIVRRRAPSVASQTYAASSPG